MSVESGLVQTQTADLPIGMMAVAGLSFDAARLAKVSTTATIEADPVPEGTVAHLLQFSADIDLVRGFDASSANQSGVLSVPSELEPAEVGATDETFDEVPAAAVSPAQSLSSASHDLISIMTLPSGHAQPQERLFACDALIAIVPHLQEPELLHLTRTVSRMDTVSDKLRSLLVRHSNKDISSRMLKSAQHLPDRDLISIISDASEQQLRLIARRRNLSASVSQALIRNGNMAAILDLLRNAQCDIGHTSFAELIDIVEGNAGMVSALCNREDLPQSVGLRLFWQADGNLRRYLLSRFLVESSALNKVIEIGIASGAIPPLSEKASPSEVDRLVVMIETGADTAHEQLAQVCRIAPETASLIVTDKGGESLAVVLKALSQSRLTTAEVLKRWVASPTCALAGPEKIVELHALFDSLSINKSRMLLSYWDWAIRDSGPYSKFQI